MFLYLQYNNAPSVKNRADVFFRALVDTDVLARLFSLKNFLFGLLKITHSQRSLQCKALGYL